MRAACSSLTCCGAGVCQDGADESPGVPAPAYSTVSSRVTLKPPAPMRFTVARFNWSFTSWSSDGFPSVLRGSGGRRRPSHLNQASHPIGSASAETRGNLSGDDHGKTTITGGGGEGCHGVRTTRLAGRYGAQRTNAQKHNSSTHPIATNTNCNAAPADVAAFANANAASTNHAPIAIRRRDAELGSSCTCRTVPAVRQTGVAMPMKICNGCGRMTTARRCPPCQQAHDRAHNRQRAAKTKAQGRNTAAWRKLRAAVLARDGHACRRCGSGHYLTAHLHPALGGNHRHPTLADCDTLCASCHGSDDAPRASGRADSRSV